MNMDDQQDRRRHPRVMVDVPVRLTLGRESVPGRLRDICRDAALVEVHRDCALGSDVSLMFELSEEDGPMQVAGQVIRVAPGDGDARAVAVIFRDLHPTAEGRIEMFLHRRG
jgi:PilZ domain-containing protein